MTNFIKVSIFLVIFILGLIMGFLSKNSEQVKIVTITKTDTTLVNKIKQLEEENNILLDELQFKESEISYWGRKYDELKNKHND
jgi:hypothetical protein